VKETGATHLLYDGRNQALAQASLQHGSKFDIVPLATAEIWHSFLLQATDWTRSLSPLDEADTLAIIFHTSGSTGLPKPIYQTHRVWTRSLPCKPGSAAYTTTPLYHGGASDFLRALMSKSGLYFFTSERPITAPNVLASLGACPPIAYFLAVPFVLKLLAEDVKARQKLAEMDMISVGGAPLPEEIGDRMVKEYKWKLVSRMGSAECGCTVLSLASVDSISHKLISVLMSSWRDFETDKEWSYLRNEGSLLTFEKHEKDIAELVVDSTWPTLVS